MLNYLCTLPFRRFVWAEAVVLLVGSHRFLSLFLFIQLFNTTSYGFIPRDFIFYSIGFQYLIVFLG